MELEFKNRLSNNNWSELAALYLDAGMGHKAESRLSRVFGNSEYQSFLYIEGQLIGAARAFTDGGDCAMVCDVSILKAYQSKGLGFGKMTTGMCMFKDHAGAISAGYIVPSSPTIQ